MKNRIKISLSLLVFLSFSLMAYAQSADSQSDVDPDFLSNLLGSTLLIVGVVVVVFGLGALVHINNQLMQTQKKMLFRELGVDPAEKPIKEKRESFGRKLYKRMTKTVPLSKEEDILFNHSYDGIRELDNNLPPWWVAMFYITIIFAGGYLYYHFSGAGQSSAEAYETEMKTAEKAVKAYLASQEEAVDENTVTILQDEEELALGKNIYDNLCMTCHGALGEGGIGPNFTDKFWLHGGTIKDLFSTVKYGVPEMGMISWKSQLRPVDIQRVTSFILTMQGTNPPNQKDPQGDLFEGSPEGDSSTSPDDTSDASGGN